MSFTPSVPYLVTSLQCPCIQRVVSLSYNQLDMLQYKRPGATSMFIEYSAISQFLDAALRTISPRSL